MEKQKASNWDIFRQITNNKKSDFKDLKIKNNVFGMLYIEFLWNFLAIKETIK